MPDYLNSNGLVNGNIPSNHSCPFIDTCGRKNDNCPSLVNLRVDNISCALARLNSMILETNNPLLKETRDRMNRE